MVIHQSLEFVRSFGHSKKEEYKSQKKKKMVAKRFELLHLTISECSPVLSNWRKILKILNRTP